MSVLPLVYFIGYVKIFWPSSNLDCNLFFPKNKANISKISLQTNKKMAAKYILVEKINFLKVCLTFSSRLSELNCQFS